MPTYLITLIIILIVVIIKLLMDRFLGKGRFALLCIGAILIFIGTIVLDEYNEKQEKLAVEQVQLKKRQQWFNSHPEKMLPQNGIITTHRKISNAIAPLEIKSSDDNNFYIKLINKKNKKTIPIFIRANSTHEVEVPLGSYELKYATGEKWFGEADYFGPDTQYFKADEIFNFSREGRRLIGHTLVLYLVSNGNLETDIIEKEDF